MDTEYSQMCQFLKSQQRLDKARGKGAVEFWAAKVRPGKILFEIDGVPKNLAMAAFELAICKTTH